MMSPATAEGMTEAKAAAARCTPRRAPPPEPMVPFASAVDALWDESCRANFVPSAASLVTSARSSTASHFPRLNPPRFDGG